MLRMRGDGRHRWRAGIVALGLGLGVLGSLAAPPASFAAGNTAHPPAVGANCQTDGKINGGGSILQANGINDAFTYGFQEDVCGPQATSTNLNTDYEGLDPSDFTFGAGPTTVDGMVAYNYSYLQFQTTQGSLYGLERMDCRTDFFAGTSLPYNNTELYAMDGPPASENCAYGLDTTLPPPPFGPQTAVGYPNTDDAGANVMAFPVAGAAVAYATNTNGVCPLPLVTGLDLTANEFDQIWQGTLNQWASSSLETTNPSADPSASTATSGSDTPNLTTVDANQTLPASGGNFTVVSTAGFPTGGGTLEVSSTTGTQTLTYTSINGNTFVGTAGGTGSVIAGQDVAGVGTLTVASTTGFPSSGALTVGSETLRYTGTAGGSTFTGVTASSAAMIPSGTTVDSASPLAGCTWGQATAGNPAATIPNAGDIQRVARWDGSGPTTFTMFTLAGIDGHPLCGSKTGTDWYQLAATNASLYINQKWPQFTGSASPDCEQGTNPAPNPLMPENVGSGVLVTLLKATNGGIGYAETAAWGAPSSFPAGMSLANLQTYADEQFNGLTVNNPGPDGNGNLPFSGPGPLGSVSRCKLPVSIPTGLIANQAVGLGNPTWTNTGTVSAPGAPDVAWSTQGSGYPVCGLTFDLVYSGSDNESGEATNPQGPGCVITEGDPNGACYSVQGPLQGATNDQLRTLYSYFTYVFTPLAQNGSSTGYLPAQTLDPLPAQWLPYLTAGYQQNF